MRTRTVFASWLLLTLVGCATSRDGYGEFYEPRPGITSELIADRRLAPPPEQPQVIHQARSFDETTEGEYFRKGYVIVGYSSFTSGNRQYDDDAIALGRKVGADLVVILDQTYAGSVTTSVPISAPTTSTSYTNGSAATYGTGGSATAFSNSTTTTSSTSTKYVPMTVNRYEYAALCLVKVKFKLGVRTRGLSDQERQDIQTNRGVFVTAIADGTPAYQSDMLFGDVISAIDGSKIDDVNRFDERLTALIGKTAEFTIIRHGKTISKTSDCSSGYARLCLSGGVLVGLQRH